MSKILKMPKRTSPSIAEEVCAPLVSQDHQPIVRYPRLQRGSYFADFMRDKRLHPEVYHCVIQREGSNEILSWTQERTLEAAMKRAENELTRLSGSRVAEA